MLNALFVNILRRNNTVVLKSLNKNSTSPISNNIRSFVVLKQNFLLSKDDTISSGGSSSTSGGGVSKKNKDDTGTIKITLIGPNNAISVTSLTEAQKLSKRRELKLIKLQDLDPKTQRPVYRLYTPAELLAEETEDQQRHESDEETKSSSAGKKSEKSLTIGSKIADHDILSRIKNILKWLKKGHEVRILIQGVSSDDTTNCDRVFQKIETAIKESQNGRIVQKRNKNGNIKFNILPTPSTAAAAAATSGTTTNKL